ncbi:MAG: type II toxin-antitoxin system VapC family toxin [Actinomycetota bacterium]
MKVVDANLLLYAYDSGSSFHPAARSFWESCLSDPEPVGLSGQTLSAFVRIGTNPRAFANPMTLEEACSHVDEWLARPMVRFLSETERHWPVFRRLLLEGQASGNLVSDAHLAAVAIENGAELHSTDNDFSRFPGLRWQNPLAQ